MKKIILSVLIFTASIMNVEAQVGIGTTTPEAALDVVSEGGGFLPPRAVLTSTSVQAPVTNPKTGLVLVDGTIVYNTNTINDVTPGLYYWKDLRWVKLYDDYGIELFELTSDVLINSTSYVDVPTMSYSFIARRPSVIIELTGSGNGTTAAAGNIHFQIIDVLTNDIVCSSKTKIQNLTLMYESSSNSHAVITTTTWNIEAKGKMSNLTVGNTYTVKVQARISNAFETSSVSIAPLVNTDESLKLEIR